MYKKIICLECGFIFYVTHKDIILAHTLYEDIEYVKCRLCGNKQEYKTI